MVYVLNGDYPKPKHNVTVGIPIGGEGGSPPNYLILLTFSLFDFTPKTDKKCPKQMKHYCFIIATKALLPFNLAFA